MGYKANVKICPVGVSYLLKIGVCLRFWHNIKYGWFWGFGIILNNVFIFDMKSIVNLHSWV